MAEHVFPFIIDGVRVGLTERQYGARLPSCTCLRS